MLATKYLKSFRKDRKKLSAEQKEKLVLIVEILMREDFLEAKHRDHILTGNYKECVTLSLTYF